MLPGLIVGCGKRITRVFGRKLLEFAVSQVVASKTPRFEEFAPISRQRDRRQIHGPSSGGRSAAADRAFFYGFGDGKTRSGPIRRDGRARGCCSGVVDPPGQLRQAKRGPEVALSERAPFRPACGHGCSRAAALGSLPKISSRPRMVSRPSAPACRANVSLKRGGKARLVASAPAQFSTIRSRRMR